MPDKNLALEHSIANMREQLFNSGFQIEEQTYRNPIANVWSLSICDSTTKLLTSYGIGSSKQAALASALKQFCERLTTHYFWKEYYLGDSLSNNTITHFTKEKWFKTNKDETWPKGILNNTLHDFYNPDGELNCNHLIDISSSNTERGICCLPYKCIRTQKTINFPKNITDNLYSYNGISSGSTREEAYVNALSEIIENYVRFKVVAEEISLPIIPESILSDYPYFDEINQKLLETESSLLIHDASLNGKYPVVSLTLINSNSQGLLVSFGAHPQFNVALQRAFNYLFQALDFCINNNNEAGFDIDEIASPNNLKNHFKHCNGIVSWAFLKDDSDFEFNDWGAEQSSTNSKDEFDQLCELIHADNNDIYISEYLPKVTSSKTQTTIHYCHILVPGISEIYPVDDLIWENNNSGMHLRNQILNTNKTPQECEQLILDLEDLNQADEYLVSDLLGMPFDTNCIFENLRLTELITLLALKTQDNERIQEGCEWLLHFKQIPSERLKVYQCINTILQLNGMTNYASALSKLYTRNILDKALALIDGDDVFPLTSDWKTHTQMIDSYQKQLGFQLSNHSS